MWGSNAAINNGFPYLLWQNGGPVASAPAITLNPSNQAVNAGQAATFSAAASGTPTPTVQWQQSTDGGVTFTNIAGATSTTYSFTTTASQNGYQYQAKFSNSVGTATTTAALLTVSGNSAPVVTLNPTSQTVNVGQTATFTAAASGTPTPTVQWQQSTNGGATFANILGATSTTYAFMSALAQSGYQYQAVFSNSVSTATTTAATLTVNPAAPAPTVTAIAPTSGTALGGTSVAITGTNFAGATAVTFGGANAMSFTVNSATSITATSPAGSGVVDVTVTTAGGTSATGASDQFTYIPAAVAPVITTNPSPQTVNLGQMATFSAAASGTPTPTVQWQQSTDGGVTFTNIAGAISTIYSFTPTVAQSGYQYRAVFTNSVGTQTTVPATLTVLELWITSVSPNPVTGSNASQLFTINGNNFVRGANVTLRDLTAGQTFPKRTPVTFSSTQIAVRADFTTAAHSWSVEVLNPDGHSSGQFPFQVVAPAAPAPTCRLTVNPASISLGQSATLAWTSTHATGGVIDNGIGSVGVSGSQTIGVSAFQTIGLQQINTFTGSFRGPGGVATCQADLAIGINIVVEMAKLANDAYAENADDAMSCNWHAISAQELKI